MRIGPETLHLVYDLLPRTDHEKQPPAIPGPFTASLLCSVSQGLASLWVISQLSDRRQKLYLHADILTALSPGQRRATSAPCRWQRHRVSFSNCVPRGCHRGLWVRRPGHPEDTEGESHSRPAAKLVWESISGHRQLTKHSKGIHLRIQSPAKDCYCWKKQNINPWLQHS